MSDPYLSINGILANTAEMRVPFGGRWIVEIDYPGSSVPSGAATIKVGALTLLGTVVPTFSGAFVGTVRARVVAGTGGWSKVVSAKSYHDDGGVRRADVLTALARDVGETIDTAGDKARLDVDLVRIAEPGARALDGILGSTPWRVDFDGWTRYGARPAAALAADAELLDFNPRSGVMVFGAHDPSSVPIGAIVTDARLGAPLVIRELDVSVKAGATRIHAWGIAA